jgi:hypothetical protein
MSVSIDVHAKDKSGLSAEDLLFIAQNPDKLAEVRADLVELRNLRAEVVKRESAVEARERVADAKATEADRVRADFLARTANLVAFLRSS